MSEKDWGRYLVDTEKAVVLASWNETLESSTWCATNDPGGYGYPDADMVPLVARINAMPGICTLQSCAGHRNAPDHFYSGRLWLRFSAAVSRAFERRAFVLASTSGIEMVRKIYFPPEYEVIDITFVGNEQGKLAENIEKIIDFLAGLAMYVHLAPHEAYADEWLDPQRGAEALHRQYQRQQQSGDRGPPFFLVPWRMVAHRLDYRRCLSCEKIIPPCTEMTEVWLCFGVGAWHYYCPYPDTLPQLYRQRVRAPSGTLLL